jgi:hypothetical protein
LIVSLLAKQRYAWERARHGSFLARFRGFERGPLARSKRWQETA